MTILTLTLAALTLAAPPTLPDSSAYAILDATVIPMDRERALPHHTVLVRDGRIEAVGPAENLAIPDDATRIDGRGRFLIPGLMDMHMHLLSDDRIATSYGPDELAVVVANGVTSARIPIGTPAHLTYREAVIQGNLLGPSLFVASPQLSGRAFGSIFNGYAVTTPEEAEAAVHTAANAGYDAIKLTFFISPEVYEAAATAAREVGLPLIGHVGPRVGLARALEVGQQIEHLDEYFEALLPSDAGFARSVSGVGVWQRANWASLDVLDAARIPAVAQATVDADSWNTPTLTFLNTSFGSGRSLEEIEASPDARFVSPAVKDELLGGHRAFWSNPPPEAQRQRYVALRNDLTKAIYDAGGRLMAGSDAPEWLLLYGFTLHRELQSLVDAGLPPYAALEAATRNPAEWMGSLDEVGTIETGKVADLVLLADDPLADIAHTEQIEGVMLHGHWLDRAALDALLDASAAALSTAPLRDED